MSISPTRLALLLAVVLALLAWAGPARAMRISAANVAELAIYGASLDTARGLAPNQVNYNVTNSSLIQQILGGINFSQPQNCSTLGSLLNAIVYVHFTDGSVARFQLFNNWSQFSLYIATTDCYPVEQVVREIIQESGQ